jgi:hypothetical protein
VGAMDFHHVATKGKNISQIGTLADIIQEFTENKIVVLCAVCHRELHHGAIKPDFSGKEIEIEHFLKYETRRTDRNGNKRWVK